MQAGEELPPNVLGPHSLASFTTEWRAYPMTTWGAMAKGPTSVRGEELGYTKDFAGHEGDRISSAPTPSAPTARTTARRAATFSRSGPRKVGMPRGYGYGASMGAWVLDYVAAWGGEWGNDHPRRREVPQSGADG